MFELRSPGITAQFSPWGAKLLSCVVDGVEVVFGPGADVEGRAGDLYSGAICGRHAGRVSNSCFPLDGAMVTLQPNAGPHQLHGGETGFHGRQWSGIERGDMIEFKLVSPDGDEGYPGWLNVTATYQLQGTVLSLDIAATTTKPTLCNLTNHAYWNMAGKGAGRGSVLNHELQIHGDHYFPLSDLLLPVGEIAPIAGTRWDFRKARLIAEDYDNCFLLNGKRGEMKHGLSLRDPESGRALDVWTTEACMQVYTAIRWLPLVIGRGGPLQPSQALAIEPQNVADAPNHPAFPSSILRPGETYRNRMEWRFS